MNWSTKTRITLIVVAGAVLLGLAALSVWSGAELDLIDVLSAVSAFVMGGLVGLGVAGGKPPPPPQPEPSPKPSP